MTPRFRFDSHRNTPKLVFSEGLEQPEKINGCGGASSFNFGISTNWHTGLGFVDNKERVLFFLFTFLSQVYNTSHRYTPLKSSKLGTLARRQR